MCQDILLCLGLVTGVHYCVLVLFLSFHFFKYFKVLFFTFYFPSLKFSRCLPQKIRSRFTKVWGYTIVSSCFLVWFFSNNLFTCSFAKVFLLLPKLSELISFIWNYQKCTGSPNIWCLIKTQLKKTSLKQFFKGVVLEQPWSTIVWLVWGVHYCVQMLPGVIFFQTIPLPVTLLQLFSFTS